MEHQLVIKYVAGRYEAQCSCGCWADDPVCLPVTRLRQVYPRLEAEHRRHVREAGVELDLDLSCTS